MDTLLHYYERFCWVVSGDLITDPVYKTIWPALGLVPVVLAALPFVLIRPAVQSEKAGVARLILSALPLLWVLVCAIGLPFHHGGEKDHYVAAQVIGWINLGLVLVLLLAGVAATVMARGHRPLAAGLVVVNLWMMLSCAAVSVAQVAGVVI